MSEIPDDIRKTAWNAAGHIYDPDNRCHSYATDIIARAIMAERERCAQLAETHIPEGIHPDDLYRWRDTAGAIAAAIRTGK